MLKALGAQNKDLYLTVLVQAILSVILGFLFGLAITLLLTVAVRFMGINLVLEVSSFSLLKVWSLSILIAAISAAIPIRQISGLDPAMVFRG
jgi:ABC-type antimicrobial peptide transport system permease subunit